MYTLKLRSISAYPATNASGEWYIDAECGEKVRDVSAARVGAAAGRRERKDKEKSASAARMRRTRGSGEERAAPGTRPAIAGDEVEGSGVKWMVMRGVGGSRAN
jgi:hypothetical protein